jgi:hypothetical protein
MMAKRRRSRGIQGAGTITQLPSGRWRLRVSIKGRQATYGTYLTEDLAADARARWRLTHLLPADDPEQVVELPATVWRWGAFVATNCLFVGRKPRRLGVRACESTTSAGERNRLWRRRTPV